MKTNLIRLHHHEHLLLNVVHDQKQYIQGEWLVTNGLGGYASSSIIGVMTRKYHALLVSALPPPFGRTIMLNHITEEVVYGDKHYNLNCEEKSDGSLSVEPLQYLKKFYLEDGLPVWRYSMDGIEIEKRIFMTYRQNTVSITYKLIEGPQQVKLKLSPLLHFRSQDLPVNHPLVEPYMLKAIANRYEVAKEGMPPLRLFLTGDGSSKFTMAPKFQKNVYFRIESWRGYEAIGDLWNPGFFEIDLKKNSEIALVASTEEWKHIDALSLQEAKKAESLRRRLLLNLLPIKEDAILSELALAADQFIIVPESRKEDAIRANAGGEEVRTIIAGYHWFTDWGRDTMISLEGLTLRTGRFVEARWILKTFAYYVRDGLIPNMFPEGQNQGLYHTADATLWFFHAINAYLSVTHDAILIDELLPVLNDIIDFHLKGTHFGIGMDQNDKLLKQGADKYQLTWMDAKVGDWVVTPRRGKAVEINALWYNALKLMEEWVSEAKKGFFSSLSEKVYLSFNQKFWIADKHYLYDVVEGENGNDAAFRPNQIFAISLKHPVLEKKYWKSVIDQCESKLFTPFGLRTLSTDHSDFKPHYEGDLRSRDAAYHQGTVWPWLIGPYIDAWLKINPDKKKQAKEFLEPLINHLSDAGVGTISEIFDATPPYSPQGCIAQAWSIAELLRLWVKTSGED